MDTQTLLGELHGRIDAMVTGDDWKHMLGIANSMHNYSFSNMVLIAYQRPGATKVAGYKKWQTLGRQVRKGTKAINILAPILRKDDETGETKCVGFKPVKVFAIEDTDGPDMPETPKVELLTGEGPAGVLAAVKMLIEAEGFTFALGQPGGEANGVTMYNTKEVIVRDDVDEAQQVKTALHELGHVLMHGPKVKGTISRAQAEVEAESVAYVVAGALGLNTEPYTFGYVVTWSGGDTKLVRATGTKVLKVAERILKALPLK